MSNEKIFYVYIYLNPLKPGEFKYKDLVFEYEPFYIGKGKGRRCFSHLTSNESWNKHKNNTIKKIKENNLSPIIIKLKEQLSEIESFEVEIEMISIIGRLDLNKGPLLNLSDGGDGHTNPNLEYRKMLSERMKGEKNINYKGKSINENHISNNPMFSVKNPFFNKNHSVETKTFLSKLRKKDSAETKEKRSLSFKATRSKNKEVWCDTFKFTTPENKTILVNNGLLNFLKENNLSHWTITQMLRDKNFKPIKGNCVGWAVEKL